MDSGAIRRPTGPGQPPTGPGQPPTGPGQPPTGLGQPPTGPGWRPNGPGQPPNGPGQPPNGPGWPPDGPGRNPDAEDLYTHDGPPPGADGLDPDGARGWKARLGRHGKPPPERLLMPGEAPTPPRTWKERLGWHDPRPPKRLLIPAGVLAVLVVFYLLDLLISRGDMPRGTTIAGVDVGGMSKTSAAIKLRAAFEPLKDRPVVVRAGYGPNPVQTNLQPGAAKLAVDYPATLAAADDQPRNPFTRFASFFTERPRDPVAQDDGGALSDTLDGVGTLVHRDATDAGVRFDGITPAPVQAANGTDLDVPAAVVEVHRQWLTGTPIVLPLKAVPPTGKVTDAAVQQAINEVAKPAVSGDVRVSGDGYEAVLSATDIAAALSFAPDGNGGLKPVLDIPKLTDILRPQLASTERPGKDATVELVGDHPEVIPSTDGHGVDYPGTLAGLVEVLKHPADSNREGRRLTAIYSDQPAKLTTLQLDGLGIKDLVSTFSTGGFAKESGENIRRAADAINGKIVLPGETFSLNDATGPRDAAEGYIDAGIIQDGHPARGIGGGVSQLATTVYNAAYFAGMTDVEHREHSYYISRYPQAREATVFEGAIDLKFRNDSKTAIFIQTVWTSTSITVKFFGTKHFDVTSNPGEREDPVDPQPINIPAGQPCTPSDGGQGFTTSDTRVMKDLDTGEVTSTTHRVKYKPSPKIICDGGPMPYPDSTAAATPASATSGTSTTSDSSSSSTPSSSSSSSSSSTPSGSSSSSSSSTPSR